MIIQFEINGIASEFGAMPNEVITTIVIRTSRLPIAIPLAQLPLAKTYLKSLANNMSNEGYVIYNGILIYKNDINLDI